MSVGNVIFGSQFLNPSLYDTHSYCTIFLLEACGIPLCHLTIMFTMPWELAEECRGVIKIFHSKVPTPKRDSKYKTKLLRLGSI